MGLELTTRIKNNIVEVYLLYSTFIKNFEAKSPTLVL